MSKGYADYRVTREMQNQPEWKPEPSPGDYSRLFLLAVIFIAFGIGIYYFERVNNPLSLVQSSVEKTFLSAFQASVEGETLLDGSEVSVYRSHESSVPGKAISATTLSGSEPAPFNSREILELLRGATKAKEMKREDMYGHPSRHFSGEFPNPKALAGQPKTYQFHYWIDLQNRKAVRLVATGKCPSNVITVSGESLLSEVFLNVRWKY